MINNDYHMLTKHSKYTDTHTVYQVYLEWLNTAQTQSLLLVLTSTAYSNLPQLGKLTTY